MHTSFCKRFPWTLSDEQVIMTVLLSLLYGRRSRCFLSSPAAVVPGYLKRVSSSLTLAASRNGLPAFFYFGCDEELSHQPRPLHFFAPRDSDMSPVERLPQRCVLGPVPHEAHIQPSDWSHIILTGAATTRSRPTSNIIAKYDRYGTNPRRAVRRRRTLRHSEARFVQALRLACP